MPNRPLSDRNANGLILFFFFITGLTGLAYELIWIRLLILAFGSTQFAVTTVLVTFMAGLALGSLIFGRIVDRHEYPLRVYARIEIRLGVYCLFSPLVFTSVKGLYLYFSGASGASAHSAGFEFWQFALSFLALIIPTTLMGGTLPVLVKYLASSSGRVGYHTAIPYSINTLGAVTGCLATGLFLLYGLGVKASVYAAGAVDILVGLLVYWLYSPAREEGRGRRAGAAKIRAAEAAGAQGGMYLKILVISAFALSGFASLTYEVLWTRLFSLVLGSSVYAFTIMLSTFLVGIGAGSILFAPLVDRCKSPVLWFSVLEATIGLVSVLSIFIYRELPFMFFHLREAFANRFWLFLFFQFLLSSAVMIIPTLCMGAIFPLVGRIYTRGLNTVGRNIGDIYFFNTAGSIFGAFIGGFIMVPVAGVQNGVVITAGLNLLISVALLYSTGLRASYKHALSAALVVFFAAVAAYLPPWERMAMTMGLYVNKAPETGGRFSFRDIAGAVSDQLVYYRDGLNAVITVRSSGDGEVVSYQANGKQEARSDFGKPTESWAVLGHVPMMLHKGRPEKALLVGLGSGITLGAMEDYPVESLDVVELEPAVVEAARYFSRANNSALDDPRVRLHITDGRSFLSSGGGKYDVIISGVSDPWISGVSNLFTYEYFSELKRRLNSGGIVAIWFSNYGNTDEEFKIGVNSFAAVFPNVSIWFHYTQALDLVLIGSVEPHGLDMGRLEGIFRDGRLRGDLARINVTGPYDVVDLYLTGGEDIRRYIGNSPVNTDERPILEFSLPRHLYVRHGTERIEELIAATRSVIPPVNVPDSGKEEFYLMLGKTYNNSNFRLAQAVKVFEKALEVNPGNKEARHYLESLKKELGARN